MKWNWNGLMNDRCVLRWNSWWVVSCMSAMSAYSYNRRWTQWPTLSTVHVQPVNVQSWPMTPWQRVQPAAMSSVSTAEWLTMASLLAESPLVSCFSFHFPLPPVCVIIIINGDGERWTHSWGQLARSEGWCWVSFHELNSSMISVMMLALFTLPSVLL